MAVTRLKRKVRKNRTKATQRKAVMKRLLATPVIKNVDIKQLKEGLTPKEDAKMTAPA